MDSDEILDKLYNEEYTVDVDLYDGGLYVIDKWDCGMHRLTLGYYTPSVKSSGTTFIITLTVEDVSFVNRYWEWSAEGTEMTDEIKEWLEDNIDIYSYGTYDDMFEMQIKTIDDAEGLLLDYDHYELNGELYYFVAPDSENSRVGKEVPQPEGRKLTRREAAEMLFNGNYDITFCL